MTLTHRNWATLDRGVAPVWVWGDGQGIAADTQTGNDGNPQKAAFQGLLLGKSGNRKMKLAAFENANEGQTKDTKKKPQNGNETSAFL